MSVVRSTVLVLVMNLAGKLLGFGRTILIAAIFGTSVALDAFWVALLLPSILPSLLGGVMTTAFVPQYMRTLAQRHDPQTWRGANTFFALCMVACALFTIVLVWAAPQIVTATAPGLVGESRMLAIEMARALLALTFPMGLNAVLTALAQCTGRYLSMSLESTVSNLAVVGCALAFHRDAGVWSLAYGIAAGTLLQSAILVAANSNLIGAAIRPAWDLRHQDFRNLARYSVPYFVGSAGTWLNTLVAQAFVSLLGAGAISALGYATVLAFIALDVIGMGLITTVFPEISRHASSNPPEARYYYWRGARLLAFVLLPISVVLMAFAEPIVSLLFQRRNFSAESVHLTAGALAWLSLALLPRTLTYFNFRALQSIQANWTQIRLGLVGVVVNVACCAVLSGPLGLRGIAIATAVSSLTTAVLSFVALRQRFGVSLQGPERRFALQLGAAAVGMLCAALLASELGALAGVEIAVAGPWWPRAVTLALAVGLGALAFIALAHRLGIDELRAIRRLVTR